MQDANGSSPLPSRMLTLEPGKPHVLQAHCDTAGQATMTFLCCKNLEGDLTTDMILEVAL